MSFFFLISIIFFSIKDKFLIINVKIKEIIVEYNICGNCNIKLYLP